MPFSPITEDSIKCHIIGHLTDDECRQKKIDTKKNKKYGIEHYNQIYTSNKGNSRWVYKLIYFSHTNVVPMLTNPISDMFSYFFFPDIYNKTKSAFLKLLKNQNWILIQQTQQTNYTKNKNQLSHIPVQRALKFSAVLGTTSAKSCKFSGETSLA